ncbi:DUF4269 domain-containing protein [Mangrovivirga cuniculi]|uniref:DUF4269 domain-containing protein n=1 Tax=Mangrovivirga cuniculi TaxID=2715131 RepID=A0A4D7JQA7_9BACT|nr:DUF4269 domain-containing protein [Mangrovivirga cuniculi]QCK15660.1 DUF4269 domain-containing protein [Mangrovivirga cuniculi]
MINFTNLEYLKEGTIRQKEAYKVLNELNIIEDLEPYSPVLSGTIPINIDLPDSDLDVICYVSELNIFYQLLIHLYGEQPGFNIKSVIINDIESIVASFAYQDFPIEIFGQNIPTTRQNAYKHMIAEYMILKEKGDEFREQIIYLKSQGYKTEPAFARLLELDGDPYLSILQLHDKQFDI